MRKNMKDFIKLLKSINESFTLANDEIVFKDYLRNPLQRSFRLQTNPQAR